VPRALRVFPVAAYDLEPILAAVPSPAVPHGRVRQILELYRHEPVFSPSPSCGEGLVTPRFFASLSPLAR
jgi:hypothetical protein